MIAIDTNLLLYAYLPASPERIAARRAIEDAANHASGWGFPFPCIGEYWSVATHRRSAKDRSHLIAAGAFLEELTRAGARIFYPPRAAESDLSGLAAELNIFGSAIFDLQIAWIAREAGATEIWTHDHAFLQIPGLKVVDPL